MVKCIATLRTKITFNINPVMFFNFCAELVRYEMKWFLMHRAVFDGINCAAFGCGPILKSALEHADDRGLTAANRTHKQQDAFADLETLCSRFEVLDNFGYWLFDTKELAGEEVVRQDFVLSAFV